MMTLLLVSFSAVADENPGIGYVLYKALTRPSESATGVLFLCTHLSARGDLYSLDLFSEGSARIFAKVEKNGACISESWDDFLKTAPCLAEPVSRALRQASSWNEQLGFNATRVIVISTDPRVSLVKDGWSARLVHIARNLKIVSSSCHYRIEIRTGEGADTKVLAQEDLSSKN